MVNLTEREKLVRRLPEPAPHPDHYLLVYKRSGKEWKLRSAFKPGEPYKKPFFDSPEALVAYIVPSDQHLRYRIGRTYKTHDQLHTFQLRLTLEYRVCDPATLVQKLERDPLHDIVQEMDSFLQQRIKSLDWASVELERIDLEHVLFHSCVSGDVTGFSKLHKFADQRGLAIERISVVRELPDQEIVVSTTALRSSREQQTTVLEHGTQALKQHFAIELDDVRNAADRRNEVAAGITKNIVRAFDNATDNIRSLDDIQRAIGKVASIQGGIAGVATGTVLSAGGGPGMLTGPPAPPLIENSSAASPLLKLLYEIVTSLGGLACDPTDRRELISFSLHIVAEALRGCEARSETLKTYADGVNGKFTQLLQVLNQEQIKLLKRLQDTEALKRELS